MILLMFHTRTIALDACTFFMSKKDLNFFVQKEDISFNDSLKASDYTMCRKLPAIR